MTLRKPLPISGSLSDLKGLSGPSCPSSPVSLGLLPALHRIPGQVGKVPAGGAKPTAETRCFGTPGEEKETSVPGPPRRASQADRRTWSSAHTCETQAGAMKTEAWASARNGHECSHSGFAASGLSQVELLIL